MRAAAEARDAFSQRAIAKDEGAIRPFHDFTNSLAIEGRPVADCRDWEPLGATRWDAGDLAPVPALSSALLEATGSQWSELQHIRSLPLVIGFSDANRTSK
jgi:hypothetical protein